MSSLEIIKRKIKHSRETNKLKLNLIFASFLSICTEAILAQKAKYT